jgi:4a-hydroxytetrahydrobiopterin dehydratase
MDNPTDPQIQENLKALPHWTYADGFLISTFQFNDFKECFSAMCRIAFECEKHGHHPDWSNRYNRLLIKLVTHDAQGVTQKDFDLAAAIEECMISKG